MADKRAKGRQSKGEKNGASKLTDADVLAIRSEYAQGTISQASLGSKYGIDQAAVHHIVRRKTWTHV